MKKNLLTLFLIFSFIPISTLIAQSVTDSAGTTSRTLNKISAINLEAKTVMKSNSKVFSINDLSEGIYIVQCKSESGKLFVCKLAIIK